MLGPKAQPEWGGFRLKYYRDAQEFFEDEPKSIKKEKDSESDVEIIDLTELSESEDEADEPVGRSDARSNKQKHSPLRKLLRAQVNTRDATRTAAQILFTISKATKKYHIEDLALM
ncbi:hypothetical protein FRC01_012449, partial [Tulasnella sp. 417]